MSTHVERLGAEAPLEDVHQTRVASRRLRSVLKSYPQLVNPDSVASYRSLLRSVSHSLALARDADVRRAYLLAARGLEEKLSTSERARLADALDASCAVARAMLERRLREPTWRRTVGALERLAADPTLLRESGANEHMLSESLRRRWRRVVAAARNANAGDLHRLRIRCKHLRYAFEALEPMFGRKLKTTLACLREAQDTLGYYHDAETALTWLDNELPRLGPGLIRSLRQLIAQDKKAARKRVDRALRAIVQHEPEILRRRVWRPALG